MTTTLSTNQLKDLVQYRLPEYQAFALAIHDHPRISNHEFYSSAALIKQLEKGGFWVGKEVARHRTGFDVRYISNKPGPAIAFLAEFDALPGIGHVCGHSLFGTYSVLAASTVKQFIDETSGETRVYDTPGEEGGENGSAKGGFVREGFFEGVDAASCVHLAFHYRRTTESLANDPVDIKLYSVVSHAAAASERGVDALEALIQMFNGISALRLRLPEDVSIHGIITDEGVTANVIPNCTAERFYSRAGSRQTLDEVYEKVENIIRGTALSTGAAFEFGLFQDTVDDVTITPSFDDLFFQHAKEARVPGEGMETRQRTSLGSSDTGNVSQVIPTIQSAVAISEICIAEHTEEFKVATKSEEGLASIAVAAELLANTVLDPLREPELLERIRQEHQEMVTGKEQEGATFQ